MENLDIYDENMNKIGCENRDIVHQKGMWHKTVHCWLYDDNKNLYFQIRANSGKLYTTASGHVLAGETVPEAFKREIFEEIGVNTDISNAEPIEIVFWRQDKIKNNLPWHDRAFAHVYINKIPLDFNDFHFQASEVDGVVKINAVDCLDVLIGKKANASATKITAEGMNQVDITKDDFLAAPNETAVVKYGNILQSIIQKI